MALAHRRTDIQGLRALAVLSVVVFHAGLPVPGGYVGVDIFFVISGFVITAMLAREREQTGGLDLKNFYVRRFRRLTPALAAMVAVTVIIAMLVLSPFDPQRPVIATAVGAILLYANLAIPAVSGGYFDSAAEFNPLLHTWTLSLEEQFYLIFPLLLLVGWWLAARRTRWGRAPLILTAVLSLVSLSIALAGAAGVFLPHVPHTLAGFYGPLGRVWEFGVGAMLALTLAQWRGPRWLSVGLGVVGAVVLAYCFFGLSDSAVFPGPATLLPVAGAAMLLVAGSGGSSGVTAALSWRPLVWLGDRSYSLYLWHWPVIVFASALWPGNPAVPVMAAAASIVPALISYTWIEQPLRKGRAGRAPFIRLVAVTLAVPLVATACSAVVMDRLFVSPQTAAYRDSIQLHAGELAGCLSYIPLTPSTVGTCTWNASATGKPVYLVGDSIAEHYSEGLIEASSSTNRPLVITTAGGCGLLHVWLPITEDGPRVDLMTKPLTTEPSCVPYIEGTLDLLEGQPAGTVVIGTTDVSYWSPSALLPGVGEATLFERQSAVVDGLTETVTRLEEAGHEVVVAEAPPSYRYMTPAWSNRTCSIWVIASGGCMATASVAEMDELQALSREAIEMVADQTGATVFDTRPIFCPGGECSTRRGNLELYLDDIHLSVGASAALAPEFTALLSKH